MIQERVSIEKIMEKVGQKRGGRKYKWHVLIIYYLSVHWGFIFISSFNLIPFRWVLLSSANTQGDWHLARLVNSSIASKWQSMGPNPGVSDSKLLYFKMRLKSHFFYKAILDPLHLSIFFLCSYRLLSKDLWTLFYFTYFYI